MSLESRTLFLEGTAFLWVRKERSVGWSALWEDQGAPTKNVIISVSGPQGREECPGSQGGQAATLWSMPRLYCFHIHHPNAPEPFPINLRKEQRKYVPVRMATAFPIVLDSVHTSESASAQHFTEGSSQGSWAIKLKLKASKLEWKKQYISFADDMTVYIENTKESTLKV